MGETTYRPAGNHWPSAASTPSRVCRQFAEGQDCRRGGLLDDDLFRVPISDAEIDSGLDPLMALPATAEF